MDGDHKALSEKKGKFWSATYQKILILFPPQ